MVEVIKESRCKWRMGFEGLEAWVGWEGSGCSALLTGWIHRKKAKNSDRSVAYFIIRFYGRTEKFITKTLNERRAGSNEPRASIPCPMPMPHAHAGSKSSKRKALLSGPKRK